MGKNYYMGVNVCQCCNQAKEVYHIGKQSMGWNFIFQGYPEIRSIDDYERLANEPGTYIKDEYGQLYTWLEFVHSICLEGQQTMQQFLGKKEWAGLGYWTDRHGNEFDSSHFT